MALQGTLQDFPIADIFQLIGHQRKTGILVLKRDDEEVRVFFHEGKIFRAQPGDRSRGDLLGDVLVRAEMITAERLEASLTTQRRTLQRLGDILVESGAIDREEIQRVADLQTSETIYALFHWISGTYEFEQRSLEVATDMAAPIPAENVLMEGVRRVDEWPMIRKNIPDLDLVFKRTVDLDLPGEGLDKGAKQAKKRQKIGANERTVYKLVNGRRTVRELVDMAVIGEFETCKALWNLLNAKSIRRAEAGAEEWDEGESLGEVLPGMLLRGVVGALFTLVVIAVVGATAFAVMQVSGSGPKMIALKRPIPDRLQQKLAAGAQRTRLARSLEVYAFQRGQYPEKLEELLVDESIDASDLRYPWEQPYYYARHPEQGYVLLDPKE